MLYYTAISTEFFFPVYFTLSSTMTAVHLLYDKYFMDVNTERTTYKIHGMFQ